MTRTAAALPDPIAEHAAAIGRLLALIAISPSEPATITFKSAIARHGRELIATGGTKAMRAVLDQVAGQGKDRMPRRTIIHDAWARVPGWHLGAGAGA